MFTDFETLQVEDPAKAATYGMWCQEAPETCNQCGPFINRFHASVRNKLVADIVGSFVA